MKNKLDICFFCQKLLIKQAFFYLIFDIQDSCYYHVTEDSGPAQFVLVMSLFFPHKGSMPRVLNFLELTLMVYHIYRQSCEIKVDFEFYIIYSKCYPTLKLCLSHAHHSFETFLTDRQDRHTDKTDTKTDTHTDRQNDMSYKKVRIFLLFKNK